MAPCTRSHFVGTPDNLNEALHSLKVWCLQADRASNKWHHEDANFFPRRQTSALSDTELDARMYMLESAYPMGFRDR